MITIGFLPWWPANPYQVLLKAELNKLGLRVIGNPPLSILRLLIGRDGLDVVHVHWPHGLYMGKLWRFPYVLLVLALYRLLKDNLVWTVHELDFYETRFRLPDRIIRAFLMRGCRTLIVHAESSAREIQARFSPRGRMVVSHHPSYAGYYADEVSPSDARRRLSIPSGKKVFLFFGYVKPYKGVEDLIGAFARVSDPDAMLLVAGTPLTRSLAEDLRQRARPDPRIRLDLRYIPDNDIQLYFTAADVVVFPFRRTHTSGSIMLAMSFGKPMIAPAIASIPEYVDSSMAELFDPEEAGSLEAALRRTTQRDLKAMGEAGLIRAQSFSWATMAQNHLDAYGEASCHFSKAPPSQKPG